MSLPRTLSAYVHVPYCRVRCGYCDFNTYTSAELRGTKQSDFVDHVSLEIGQARSFLDDRNDTRVLDTVFFGGGTPTLLPAANLVGVLHTLRSQIGITRGAEITVEANPDSVDSGYLTALKAGGFTRISFGVQSAVPEVLTTLDRTHDPSRIAEVVSTARSLDLDVSIDLIYGSPGESLDDWQRSLDMVKQLNVDHVSAYSLIVEDGTALERKIRRGEVAQPDPSIQADMYELADQAFESMGLSWYELSNWSRSPQTESAHNLAYWRNQDWWGFGAGAHSHLDGRRWWNVKHPAAYAQRVLGGASPELDGEVPTSEESQLELVLLGTRLREGFPVSKLDIVVLDELESLRAEGLISPTELDRGAVVLTLRGRLLADAVVRRLTI